jgi:hypothetical protein
MIRRVLPPIAVMMFANLAMIAAAAANRRGQPEALVRLTERELALGYNTERNSARELRLVVAGQFQEDWLDRDKLAMLGFDCRVPATDTHASEFYRGQLPRRAFAAFELEGARWTRYVQELERQRSLAPTQVGDSTHAGIDRELHAGSRLFAIDAALDATALRTAHPDRSRYLIVPATVRIFVGSRRVTAGSEAVLSGSLSPVVHTIVVPLHARNVLDHLDDMSLSRDRAVPWQPRYAASLAVGSRYEPWIVSIDPLRIR